MQVEIITLYSCITIFALGLFIVAILSYREYKNTKLLFVAATFLVLLIKGLILSLGLYYLLFRQISSSEYIAAFDLVILVLLFLATLKR